MPNDTEVRQYVLNALNTRRLDLARPWRDTLLGEGKDASSLTLLGRLCADDGDVIAGLAYTGEAIRLEPYYADAYLQRGNLLAHIGAFDAAIDAYRSVLRFVPLHHEVLLALVRVATQARRPADAVAALRHRLLIGPETAEIHNMLGLSLHGISDLPGAHDHYLRATQLDPVAPLYWSNLATILYHFERFGDALSVLDQSLRLDPNYAIAWHNVGNVHKATRQIALAEQAYRRAVELAPDYNEAHFNLGCAMLQQDNWRDGWSEYEWRWKVPGLVAPIYAGIPLWTGQDINGRRVMVVAEQGSGDTIQFVRYARTLVDRGATVVVWAPPETAALLRRIPYITQVASNRNDLPPCEFFAPMLSLPRLLGSTPQQIPSAPYLTYDKRRQAQFIRMLGPRQEKLRLGIVWGGNPHQVEDRHRSAPLSELTPLLKSDAIRWIGLQKGHHHAQLKQAHLPIEDWSKELDTFDTTAALMGALDGVVSVCSAPLHLAGALGLPCVALLSHAADWRWREDEQTTPYYPTMTLVRQTSLNDWHDAAIRALQIISAWEPKAMPRELA